VSDAQALTVPPAGWYPDRNEANVVRWWDGQQWTDQTRSTAPAAAAFEQPISATAFGIAAPQAAAGWYPDDHGGRATAAPMASAVNSLATRGMIYSLIGLVLNPFAMMSIGGFVLGIRSLRRAKQFPPAAARRGQAITAIVLGAFGTVATVLLIIGAIATAMTLAQRTSQHVFDQHGAERQILSQLRSAEPAIPAVSVSCPPDAAMRPGDTFDCRAQLNDGSSLPVHVAIVVDNGVYSYTWTANASEASGTPGSTADQENWQADHAATGTPFTLSDVERITSGDLSGHYAEAVASLTCDPGAAVGAGDFFQCVAKLADGRSLGLQIAMSQGSDGGFNMMILTPPAGGAPVPQPSAPPSGSTGSSSDLSNS